MQSYVLVFLGAGFGGACRHAVNLAVARSLPASTGVSTLIVNVLGSFAMGVLIEWLALKGHASSSWQLFLATGVLGGFTTFSAFSLESVLLYERGHLGWAAVNVLVTVTLSIAALFAGLFVVRHMPG